MNKIFVLDTNVLLHDPMAIHAFAEHRVIIPMTVLEELDAIKDRRDKDVSREARIAINAIDDILENASPKLIQAGVEIPGTSAKRGKLAIFPDQLIEHSEAALLLNNPVHHYNDDRIINVALHLQAENSKRRVCLVTKDINMRLKAKGSGLEHVEDYKKDKVVDDIEFMAKGYEQYQGDFWAQVD
ncbi:MAG: PhoH family protein, partial [Gammaproteobacteria bacterium]|nr:PhoH family protein [Gammaproteobacteria bacterium]